MFTRDHQIGFTGKVAGNLETKYKVKDLGLTLTEKWNTDNTLNTTLDVADKVQFSTAFLIN